MKKFYQNVLGGRTGSVGLLLLAILLFAVLPMALDAFRLNLVGKYLTYAFVAVGLVLLWGNSGVLSLGQGIFFGLGGYCMAMFLKLEASSVENTKIQSTPGIPDFMDWNQLTALPSFWVPFKSLPFALLAVVFVPTIIAFIVGTAMFKRRVGGVYFAVITQALALILSLGIDGNQGLTGGPQRHHGSAHPARLGYSHPVGSIQPSTLPARHYSSAPFCCPALCFPHEWDACSWR
jgi:urea transport system permease protein